MAGTVSTERKLFVIRCIGGRRIGDNCVHVRGYHELSFHERP
jgi:hypothetical protein